MPDRPTGPPAVATRRILRMPVHATSYEHATGQILRWAAAGESRYVCVATVNNVIEALDDPRYLQVIEAADLVTPDGMPLVWGLRLLGVPAATRVYGPDLTPLVCQRAAQLGVPVGFYGGEAAVLDRLTATLTRRFPELKVVYHFSPPFRRLSPQEQDRVAEEIGRSGARILFVGLGTPKQEQWMAAHRGLPTVMVGVGAAFDFLAGRKRQAPKLLRRLGLEWLFRLVQEPRRLWRRYLYRNPRFVALFLTQLLTERHSRTRRPDETQDSTGGRRRRVHRPPSGQAP
jgi:N-acetylglucosaminyldiphosphoundecaprenol N-acetyl-beta-D-mannosaminyltransferase